jgi:hypothetical protein
MAERVRKILPFAALACVLYVLSRPAQRVEAAVPAPAATRPRPFKVGGGQ